MKCPLTKETTQTRANNQRDYIASLTSNPAQQDAVRGSIKRCRVLKEVEKLRQEVISRHDIINEAYELLDEGKSKEAKKLLGSWLVSE